ncbi:MAG: hypothetical protein V3S17_03095 [candidate division Zixibacteria bacterium]|jgi:hypothetical protein
MKACFRITISVLVFLLTLGSVSKAEIDIGYSRQSGWSDNFYLENPDGWSLYLSKSFSQKMSMRLSFSRLDKNFIYAGYMAFGLIPPNMLLTWELIKSDLSAKVYEISIHHSLVEGSRMRLDVGGGFGVTNFNLILRGQTTGYRVLRTQKPAFYSFAVDVTVKKFLFNPIALRIGYQHRNMATHNITLDGFEPFHEISYSNIRVDLLGRFNADI